MTETIKIKGVGPVLAKAFSKKGFGSIEKIANGNVADLRTVSGVSEMRAKVLIKAAKLLLKNLALTEAARKAKPAKKVEKSAPKNKKKKAKEKKKKLEKKKLEKKKLKKQEKKLKEKKAKKKKKKKQKKQKAKK